MIPCDLVKGRVGFRRILGIAVAWYDDLFVFYGSASGLKCVPALDVVFDAVYRHYKFEMSYTVSNMVQTSIVEQYSKTTGSKLGSVYKKINPKNPTVAFPYITFAYCGVEFPDTIAKGNNTIESFEKSLPLCGFVRVEV